MGHLENLFRLGMKRALPEYVPVDHQFPVLNLGCGEQRLAGCDNLDYPAWDAETYALPYQDNKVGGILAFHFLEHLSDPRRMLRECFRVLRPGCPMNIVVPHYLGSMAYHDLDHKAFFAADTWSNALDERFYSKDKGDYQFRVGINVIMGITERNLALVTQLIKDSYP